MAGVAEYKSAVDVLFSAAHTEDCSAAYGAASVALRGGLSHYEVLMLTVQEVDKEPLAVKKAFYRLSKVFHPDQAVHRGCDASLSNEFFRKLTEARNVLLDPRERERYDLATRRRSPRLEKRSKAHAPSASRAPPKSDFGTEEVFSNGWNPNTGRFYDPSIPSPGIEVYSSPDGYKAYFALNQSRLPPGTILEINICIIHISSKYLKARSSEILHCFDADEFVGAIFFELDMTFRKAANALYRITFQCVSPDRLREGNMKEVYRRSPHVVLRSEKRFNDVLKKMEVSARNFRPFKLNRDGKEALDKLTQQFDHDYTLYTLASSPLIRNPWVAEMAGVFNDRRTGEARAKVFGQTSLVWPRAPGSALQWLEWVENTLPAWIIPFATWLITFLFAFDLSRRVKSRVLAHAPGRTRVKYQWEEEGDDEDDDDADDDNDDDGQDDNDDERESARHVYRRRGRGAPPPRQPRRNQKEQPRRVCRCGNTASGVCSTASCSNCCTSSSCPKHSK